MTIDDRTLQWQLGRSSLRRLSLLPSPLVTASVVVAVGLGMWVAGLAPDLTPHELQHELIAQLLWSALWLTTIERVYRAVLRHTTRAAAGADCRLGDPRSLSRGLLLGGLVVALVPLSVVSETSTQWAVNRVLYDPGFSDPRYVGWLRGWIDTRRYAELIALSREPLSAFTRRVLGWHDELHPFSVVVCSSMVGNLVWAPIALAIGTGGLRSRAPLFARAFRIAALQAATAPIASLAYFELMGGPGVNAWTALFGVLLGSLDSGGQAPMWVRLVGVSIFYLLPVLILGWRLNADRQALSSDSGRGAVACDDAEGTTQARRRADELPRAGWLSNRLLALLAGLLIGVWWAHLTAGPFGWTSQSLWLLLWLAYLGLCDRAIRRLTREASRHVEEGRATSATSATPWMRRGVEAAAVIALAWPLVIAGLVVQCGAQWLIAATTLGPARVQLEFFGWILGQVRPLAAGAGLPPAAIAAALAGNVLWLALMLIAHRESAARAPRSLGTDALRLAALQGATIPTAMGAYMVLSIVTRTEAVAGVPRYDVWHVWTYLTRAALDAPFLNERVPAWLAIATVALMIGAPLGAGTLVARAGEGG